MATLSPPRVTPSSAGVSAATLIALVVERDEEHLAFLGENLQADRFAVLPARSAEEALALASGTRPDVAVVNCALPGMSGFDLVSTLRDGRATAVWNPAMAIVMTADNDDPHAVVRGIERGADDVVLKPVNYAELLARIGAQLRRAQGISLTGSVRVGPLEIDRRAASALVHGRPLGLSAKEFGLLLALARDPHRVMTKTEILREVWGYTAEARTRTVDTHASRVRSKLARAGQVGWIRNVWGRGYRLLPEEGS